MAIKKVKNDPPSYTVTKGNNVKDLSNKKYKTASDASSFTYANKKEAKKALLNPKGEVGRTYYKDKKTGKLNTLVGSGDMQPIGDGMQSWSAVKSKKVVKKIKG
jgi:hypothetical protein